MAARVRKKASTQRRLSYDGWPQCPAHRRRGPGKPTWRRRDRLGVAGW